MNICIGYFTSLWQNTRQKRGEVCFGSNFRGFSSSWWRAWPMVAGIWSLACSFLSGLESRQQDASRAWLQPWSPALSGLCLPSKPCAPKTPQLPQTVPPHSDSMETQTFGGTFHIKISPVRVEENYSCLSLLTLCVLCCWDDHKYTLKPEKLCRITPSSQQCSHHLHVCGSPSWWCLWTVDVRRDWGGLWDSFLGIQPLLTVICMQLCPNCMWPWSLGED